jgi:hypothetical protein
MPDNRFNVIYSQWSTHRLKTYLEYYGAKLSKYTLEEMRWYLSTNKDIPSANSDWGLHNWFDEDNGIRLEAELLNIYELRLATKLLGLENQKKKAFDLRLKGTNKHDERNYIIREILKADRTMNLKQREILISDIYEAIDRTTSKSDLRKLTDQELEALADEHLVDEDEQGMVDSNEDESESIFEKRMLLLKHASLDAVLALLGDEEVDIIFDRFSDIHEEQE